MDLDRNTKNRRHTSDKNHLNKENKHNINPDIGLIANLIVQEFRFLKSYASVVNKLFTEERSKYISTYNYHAEKILEIARELNLNVLTFEGVEFEEGLPVSALNADEFEKTDRLIIEQVIEPAIIHSISGNAVRMGSVILAKIENKEDIGE